MANIKITDLNAIADPISTDVLPIVDVSADTTNKISIEQLLKNAAAGTAALPAFAFDDDPDTGIYRTGADGLGFSTGGTGRLFIDSSGNIGVGISDPSSKLQVDNGLFSADTTSTDKTLLLSSGSGPAGNGVLGASLAFNRIASSAGNQPRAAIAIKEYTNNFEQCGLTFFTHPTSTGTDAMVEQMCIRHDGNVGVGTTNPQARLHVAESGGATISLQDSSANNGVNYASIQADGTTALVLKASGGTTGKDIKFFTTTSNERLRIDASGRLLHGYPTVISKLRDGQTTTNTRNASHQQVGNNSGDAGKAYLAYHSANSSYYSPHIWLGKSASDTKGTDALVTSGTDLGNILFAGNDGSKFVNAARILAEVDGTAAADDMPGKLAFFTTPSGSDVPVQRLTIKNDGNVGVGTATPSYLLQVTSSGTGSETVAAFGNANISEGLQIETNGNLDWGFNALNSRNLTFSTNQLERVRIDSVGRFIAGHGASVPTVIPGYSTNYDTKTQFIGANYSDNSWLSLARFGTASGTSGGAYLTLSKSNGATAGTHAAVNADQHLGAIGFAASDGTSFVNAAHIAASAGGTVGANQMSGQLLFYTNDGSNVSTERMRIDENGLIGMGTTAPALNLDIHNIDTEDTTLRVYNSGTGSSSDTILRCQVGGTTASNYIYFGDTHDNDVGRIRYLHSNNSLTFRVNAADALTIDNSQQVGIGTASPSSILHIKGGGPLIIENGPSSSFGVEEFLRVDDGGGVNDRALQGFELANGGSRSHAISHNLNITSDGSAYTYTQGNYTGSNLIEFGNGQIKIYADEQVTSGSQDAITPTEVFRIDNDGAVDILANDLTVYDIKVGRGPGAQPDNTAVGRGALGSNTTGNGNTAIGSVALDASTTGNNNTAVGAFALSSSTTADHSVGVGYGALYQLTTANQNTAVGYQSLNQTTTGSVNTATGYRALYGNTTGTSNVAFGNSALQDNTTGSNNTVVGTSAGGNVTTGNANAAFGKDALLVNTTGGGNIAIGHSALLSPSVGSYGVAIGYESQRYANDTTTAFTNSNTSVGFRALRGSTTPANNTGLQNTAIGHSALRENTSGLRNVAVGSTALALNTGGNNNTAVGEGSLVTNTTGSNNVAVGHGALTDSTTASANTAVGVNAGLSITTGTTNTCIGRAAGDSLTTGSNNTVIGYNAAASSATVSNEITLGNSSIATLRCQVQTISSLSDARDKTNIQPLGAGLQFVNALNPVSFDWNMRDGGKVGVPDTGFIAQELQEAQDVTGTVIPGLVYDNNPEKLEASYGKLLPTLVKAIQELSAENAELKARLEAAGI